MKSRCVVRVCWTLCFGSLITIVASGCSTRPTDAANATGRLVEARHASEPVAEQAVAPGGPASAVTLKKLDGAGYRELIAAHKGKVVLVDFWATWCVPCVRQFPHTVELSRTHREKGLAVVSVSMDEPESEAKVLEFLRERRAGFDNVISDYGAGTEFVEAFDIRGDVPFYKLYDRGGQLRWQFSADPSGLAQGEPLERMNARIDELLAE